MELTENLDSYVQHIDDETASLGDNINNNASQGVTELYLSNYYLYFFWYHIFTVLVKLLGKILIFLPVR